MKIQTVIKEQTFFLKKLPVRSGVHNEISLSDVKQLPGTQAGTQHTPSSREVAKCSSTSSRSVPSCPHTALGCCPSPAILIPPEAGGELPELLLLGALHAPQDKVLPAYKLPSLLLHRFPFLQHWARMKNAAATQTL